MNQLNKDLINEKILNDIKKIIFSHLDNRKYKIFLFWSRVLWNARYNSDYDIGIEWIDKVPFNTFHLIKSDLEDLPALIDVVDFEIVSKDFKEVALKKIKYL